MLTVGVLINSLVYCLVDILIVSLVAGVGGRVIRAHKGTS